jgi:hypothetical protein
MMVFSPPTKKAVEYLPPPPVCCPVLTLGKFSESIWIDFGDSKNIVGVPRSMPFKLKAMEVDAEVEVCKVPKKKGFEVDFDKVRRLE